MIPALNTSSMITPTVLKRVVIQFMTNTNIRDHRLFLSILIYHLFAVIGTKSYWVVIQRTFTVLEGYLIGSNHIQIFSNNQYNSFAIILGF
ncbi:uncharacterized protein CYBJADRAFT_167167 [Cyberlindnera jadinii NRRL Y-1542]|uniref:Uncharacterized protein n=1 Tax=Cyberlindnera jadinii (strain ATCC 18201 / CBS 1600 / BCRC 20928 / JCM 3617 / NBRC 0987 / NRRL Y-1542) TaxID=983966 RepID=A0A1E4S4Q6_CYBJN|nr:hypothetical protein CYBJADRAFT_167167 [Cyberlindnera jadinii NRRL Y-1542]ODV74517.1 hypothetical protein CYBJADRAFT_167167 [Cyberlindnera jadinii NRRL Y-1542]